MWSRYCWDYYLVMFKGEYGTCSKCKEIANDLGTKPPKRWIVIKKSYLCKIHNEMRKRGDKPKVSSITKSSIKPKFRKPTGELEVFKLIWSERPHICNNCRVNLGEQMNVRYMSHIISKGRDTTLRLDPDNIEVLCPKCHDIHENGTIEQVKRMAHPPKKKAYLKKHDYLRYDKLFKND